MIKKKLLAGLMAITMLTPIIPASIATAAELPSSDYIFYEDFEDESYDTRFNTATESDSTKQRWESTVSKVGQNKMLKYTLKNVSANNFSNNASKIFNAGLRDLGKFDSTAWYEFGYKMDVSEIQDLKLRLFSLYGGIAANASWDTWISIWEQKYSGTTKNFKLGVGNRENSTGSLPISDMTDVDGLVSVKVLFNMHTEKIHVNNTWNHNVGEVIVSYSYKSKSTGEIVTKSLASTNFRSDIGQENQHVYELLAAFSAMEPIDSGAVSKSVSSGYGKDNAADHQGKSFYIDDIYFKKVPTYDVTFDHNDGTGATTTLTSDLDGNVDLLTVTREGYTFDGWYTAEGESFDGTNVASDMTVTAKWLKEYYVTYNTGDSDVTVETGVALEGDGTVELPEDPRRIGYEFDGWYYDEDVWENEFDGTGITGDVDVWAKWIVAHKITFVAPDADEEVEPRYAVSQLKNVPEAVRTGYRFDGWYFDDETFENEFTSDTVIDGPVTVYAAWTRKHVVTLESFGGGDFDVIYTLDPIDVATLPEPSKKGFGFEEWCVDEKMTIPFDGTVTGDMTLYARYNNVIFYEDFEDTDGTEYLKLFTSHNLETMKEDGAGVVTEEDGNKAFRVPYTDKVIISIPEGGAGLYELSVKVKAGSGTPSGHILTPYTGKTEWGSVLPSGNQFIGFFTQQPRMNVWDTAGQNWVKLTVFYDTVNARAKYYAEWDDAFGTSHSEENSSYSDISVKGDYIDGIAIGNISRGTAASTASNVYLDELSVKKIEQPTVTAITPADNAMDVSTNPEIKIYFSDEMTRNTINSSSVYVTDEEGNVLSANISSAVENEKTVAYVSLKNELEKNSKYTVHVTKDVTKDRYYLLKEYEFSFTTVPEVFQMEAKVFKADGVTELGDTLTTEENKNVVVTLKLRNYAGKSTETYYVGAALVDTETNAFLEYHANVGTIALGDNKEVLKAEFTIPKEVTDTYKIRYFIWEDIMSQQPHWDTIELP